MHEPRAVDPLLRQSAPLVRRAEVCPRLLDRVAVTRDEPVVVHAAVERSGAHPARIVVRRPDPRQPPSLVLDLRAALPGSPGSPAPRRRCGSARTARSSVGDRMIGSAVEMALHLDGPRRHEPRLAPLVPLDLDPVGVGRHRPHARPERLVGIGGPHPLEDRVQVAAGGPAVCVEPDPRVGACRSERSRSPKSGRSASYSSVARPAPSAPRAGRAGHGSPSRRPRTPAGSAGWNEQPCGGRAASGTSPRGRSRATVRRGSGSGIARSSACV